MKQHSPMIIPAAAIVLCLPLVLGAQSVRVDDPGSVVWFDLLTEDINTARDFYGKLWNWEYERRPSGNYLVTLNGELVGGISQIDRTLPNVNESTWVVGVRVGDLPESVATARRLGARILKGVTHSEGMADWAVIEDPWGAQLLLLAPERPLVSMGGAGTWAWAELWTHEPDAAAVFYEEVVGWSRSSIDREDGTYMAFEAGGEARAGIFEIDNPDIGSGWAPYLSVTNVAQTLERVRELGGQVLLEPSEENYGGTVAIVADPTGVGFLVIEMEMDEQ